MTDKQTVLAKHPDAAAWMNPDSGTYMILLPPCGLPYAGELRVSLTGPCEDEEQAWKEARAMLMRKEGR